MRIQVLATDYDRTLATHGRVMEATLAGLERFKDSGRKLVLVTGRRLPELGEVFPGYGLFDRVVAENGALLHDPATRKDFLLAPESDLSFVAELKTRGVRPLAVGRSIVATASVWSHEVKKVVEELKLPLQLIFNRESLMILPRGVDKGTGVNAALEVLGLPNSCLAAVGDAENDLRLIAQAEFAVSVANGVPELKAASDWVTRAPEGEGVVELIELLLGRASLEQARRA